MLPPSLRWRRDTPLTSAGGKASDHSRTMEFPVIAIK